MVEYLLIVDMQEKFEACDGKTIRACHKEILKAVKNNHKIFFLEYENFGSTVSQLTEACKDSHKIIIKNTMGGGSLMVDYWKWYGKLPDKVNVVGVNSEQCVAETAFELAAKLPFAEINLLRHACNTESSWFKWRKFFKPFLEYYNNLRSIG